MICFPLSMGIPQSCHIQYPGMHRVTEATPTPVASIQHAAF